MLTTLTATSVPKRCIKSLSLRLSDFQENINENADHIRTCEMIVCTAKQIISYAIDSTQILGRYFKTDPYCRRGRNIKRSNHKPKNI